MMESLFRLTELESRVSDQHERARRRRRAPRRLARAKRCGNGSTIAATCCCAARGIRLAAIDRRLELLAGMIIVFLNLDEVIRIIREDDEPKEALLQGASSSTDMQAELHSRHAAAQLAPARGNAAAQRADELTKEKGEIEELLASEKPAMEDDRRQIREVEEELRARHQDRQTPHDASSQAPDIADRRSHGGDDRARAGDDRRLARRAGSAR